MLHRHHFPAHPNDEGFREFKERVARTNYDRRGKHTYRGPGFRAHLVAVLIFIIPKIGTASDLAIKIPTPDTEEKYLRSVNRTVDVFHETLQKLQADGATSVALQISIWTRELASNWESIHWPIKRTRVCSIASR